MRYVTPLLLAAGLLAGPALAGDGPMPARQVRRMLIAAAEPGGALRSAERAQFCAQTYPADFYDGWVKNGCTKAPIGPRFAYLEPAWRCLCLGHQ